ncbi:phosphomevalonate kinase [Sitodiplosis mosellana]|uniref:phosphomevalonate kinase n=1 Tax=Sitodiplosis mosellana TaxID=263140 RepID=UPI00244460D6|nr:phosphomevalonate kinase [Sitodiplosis mosellana]XP_055295622.1 phosphomevalonate kinase [Sitodiplosis mosellana]XP_055295623.1 phosphomevalonate kinase [Sitodiplosis mosellana]XP_055295624.1 phosphomevalonate kinase [Sitodiplosis mosellana]XP_055295625.1 phosphomevalonate kinase [Sitodiplosis mosellana]
MSVQPEAILLISGKRKCGKDYLSARILSRIGEEKAEIIRISEPIKLHWAKEKRLDLTELLSDGPYKEKYRKEMIVWSDSVRQRDPGFFCKASIEKSSKSIVIVSDIRRKTDIEFFRSHGYNIKTVRINASEDVRRNRGWVFESGVDDVQSECDLDDVTQWDLAIENDGTHDVDVVVEKILALIA